MFTLSVPPLGDRAANVLVASTCARRRARMLRALVEEGHAVELVDAKEPFVERVRRRPPDLVIVDECGDPEPALELLGELRMLDPVHLMPVILVAGRAPEEQVVRALLAGADDVITHPNRLRELVARVGAQLRNRRDRDLLRSVQKERSQLLDDAFTDALTGLGNRRAADRALERDVGSATSLLVMVVDVDHFKKVNDTWGHAVGDEVLRAVGRCLKRAARDGDEVARFGGEEFVIVIRDAPLKSHRAIGERFLRSLRALVLPPGLGPLRVTASIGAVSWGRADVPDPPLPPATDLLFQTADRALYQAKRSGRDALVLVSAQSDGEPVLVLRSDALA
jgi:two-component system cell cycle response regulator